MRLAQVLAWKREDGANIPETADGLEEHKALVVKYEEENGPLKPAFLALIERKYASVEEKIAEGDVARGQSKDRADHEKSRAAFARRIHKWIDFNGSKIPSTAAGIERHKALVIEYEKTFGPSSVLDREARARTYTAILDSIEHEDRRREWQAARSRTVAKQKKQAEAEQRAKARKEKERRRAERSKVMAAYYQRRNQARAKYYRYRIRLAEQRIATSEKDVMSDESLEAYRATSAYEDILKARERAKELLAVFNKNLATYEAKLAALQD